MSGIKRRCVHYMLFHLVLVASFHFLAFGQRWKRLRNRFTTYSGHTSCIFGAILNIKTLYIVYYVYTRQSLSLSNHGSTHVMWISCGRRHTGVRGNDCVVNDSADTSIFGRRPKMEGSGEDQVNNASVAERVSVSAAAST